MKTTNTITVVGTIGEITFDHEYRGEKFMQSTIKVVRMSGKEDILPLIISERLLQIVDIKNNDNVKITGQLRSRNVLIDNKQRLILRLFVTDIYKDNACNINNIELKGYLVKVPVYRKTPAGREVTDLLIAVNRNYGKSDYIPCIAWGRNARFVNNLMVGTPLVLAGRFQSREYNKRLPNGDIDIRTAYEVSLTQIVIGDSTEGVDYARKETDR